MKIKIITAILFLLIFSFYLYTMCPTVSEGDSGEFITAAVNLSIPHAPGYPLYTIIGKAFQWIVPCGSFAYRINLVSVVSAALASALVFYFLSLMGAGIAGSMVAALFLASSSHFFENALVAEVFGLHALLIVMVMGIVVIADRQEYYGKRKACLVAAFVSGIAYGNHQTFVLMGPALLFWFFLVHTENWKIKSLKTLVVDGFISIFFFFAGLTIYTVLPIRSLKNPFLDWSNPENWHNFWRVFTRADYGSFRLMLGEKIGLTPLIFLKQVMRYAGALADEFTIIGVLLGIAGFGFWLFGKEKKYIHAGTVAFISFVFSGVVFLTVANMPFDAQAYGVLGRFYIMPAIFFSFGIGYFFRVLRGKRYFVFSFLFFLVPVFLFINNHAAYSRRNFFIAYDYGKNILRSLPYGAVLFIDGGDDTFYTLAYLTGALGLRKDLEIHDRGGLIFPNAYGDDFRRIGKKNKNMRRQAVEKNILLTKKPLYYSTMNRGVLKGARLYARGVLFKAREEGEKDLHKNLWPLYSFRGVYPCSLARSVYRVRALLPFFDYLRGIYMFEKNRIPAGFAYWQRAYHMGRDIMWFIKNAGFELVMKGYHFYEKGNHADAERSYLFAVEIDPEAYLAYTHLGVLAEKRDDLQQSEEYYKKAISIKPDHVAAHYNLSVVYWRKNEWDNVIKTLRKVLELKPDHTQAPHYLQQALYRKQKRQL